jgi:hypothetical protein
MNVLLGRGGAPSANDRVIPIGDGPVWKYALSGLSNLWIGGGISFAEDGCTFSFSDIQHIHNLICDDILSQQTICGAEFRFLRKEMQLTLEEFSSLSGLDLLRLDSWEKQDGFAVDGAEAAMRRLYASWRSGNAVPAVRGVA